MTDLPHAIQATVKKINDKTVLLETKDGQTLEWPIALLHGEVGEGDTINLLALSKTQSEEEKRSMARHVLNELLGSSNL